MNHSATEPHPLFPTYPLFVTYPIRHSLYSYFSFSFLSFSATSVSWKGSGFRLQVRFSLFVLILFLFFFFFFALLPPVHFSVFFFLNGPIQGLFQPESKTKKKKKKVQPQMRMQPRPQLHNGFVRIRLGCAGPISTLVLLTIYKEFLFYKLHHPR